MASLDELISKIPRPIFVFIILAIALAVIISQNPLVDGCQVEVSNFTRNVQGLIVGYRTAKSKIQYPKIDGYKELCVEGNSQGACDDYFKIIRKVADATKMTSEKCYPMLAQEYTKLVMHLSSGIKIMALAAWGTKPPETTSQRLGWMTESDIIGFCRAKYALLKLIGEDELRIFRDSVYKEYPDEWSEKIPLDKRSEISRPKAFKTPDNPNGTLDEKQIYEKSLFSIKCDLYI